MSQYPQQPQESYQQGQPNQNYGPPPQYPQQPQFYPQQPMMPMQPPKKKHTGRNVFLGCGGVFVAVIVIILIVVVASNANAPKAVGTVVNTTATAAATTGSTQATTAPTGAPTQVAGTTWKTIQTFTGNGTKKTAIFAVPGDWKIVYTCAAQNVAGTLIDGALVVTVYGSDNSIVDPAAVNATCKGTKTTDSTEEHQSGNVYLSVDGTGDWMITVQVPQ